LADIFQEVEEDLRRDKAAQLWRRYGTYVLVAALAIVAGTAAYVWWKQHVAARQLAEGNAFAAAAQLQDEDKAREAADAFAALAAKSADGYAMLARLRQAALLADNGDPGAAVKVYDDVARDASDPVIRDLAALQSVALSLDQADPAELKARLDPLTESGSAWRYSALQLSAMLALRTGDKAHAREVLTVLKGDPGAPSGIRQRAAELLDSLGA
jgi:hypothetical protein